MKGLTVILKKELYRVFSDRKLLMNLFVVPAIVMIAIYSLIGKFATAMSDDIESHISKTYIVNVTKEMTASMNFSKYEEGAEVTYLTQAEYQAQKEDLESKMLEGEIDLIVVADEDFEETFLAYQKAGDRIPSIALFYNPSENYSSQAYSVFAESVIANCQAILLSSRLENVEMLNVFNVNPQTIVKESKANSQFLATMLPYMVMIMLFAGAMSIGVDAFAGEKERGTLASMLVSPVKRTEIAMGKLIALAIISALSSMVYCVSMIIGMTKMGSDMTGISDSSAFGGINFGPLQIVQLLCMLIVLDYFFVAIVAILSTFAKDTKSASSLVSPVYMVVLVGAMATMFSVGSKHQMVQYAIPVYGSALAIQDICTGELSMAGFGIAIGVAVLLSVAITYALAKAFDSDKLMFNA